MEPLWRPSPAGVARTQLEAFRKRAEKSSGFALPDYAALHAWSTQERDAFWSLLWETCEVIGERGDGPVSLDSEAMPGARFFPEARLNFAENLLRRGDDGPAILFRGEHGVRSETSFAALRREVARIANAMRAAGIAPGDRIASLLPNLPETVAVMLAASSVGAVFSSCSPDFGDRGVIDRFGQIEPRWLFCADGYHYNGRAFDTLSRIPALLASLPSVERCIVVPYLDEPSDAAVASLRGGQRYAALLAEERDAELSFERLPFDHPLYVMF